MKRKCDKSRWDNAVKEYDKNPSYCRECNKKIEVNREKRVCPSDAKRRKFCSKSCAAIFNNRVNPKIKKDWSKTTCETCGGVKSHEALKCQKCVNLENFNRVWGSQIKDYLLHGSASRAKYNPIRKWARRYMNEFDDRERKCVLCGYDKFVEVAHIKPVTAFDEEELMSQVNAKENLVWLCPNHHTELHGGLISLEDLITVP